MDAGIFNAQKATCYSGCYTCGGYTAASLLFDSVPLFQSGVLSDQITFMVQYNSGYQYDRTSQSTWTSSDTTVATVGNSGLAQAVGSGNAAVNVTSLTSDPVYVQICNAYFPGCPIALTNPTGGSPVSVGSIFICSPAVRGGTTVCRAGGKGSFTNWSFTDGTSIVTSANGTISATVNGFTNATWTGTVVTGGVVSVRNKGADGLTHTLSTPLLVTSRNFHTQAPNPTKVPNGSLPGQPALPSPPVLGTDAGLGYYVEQVAFPSFSAAVVGSGPNAGYLYNSQNIVTTLFDYEIHPDLENPGSPFYQHQTGSFNSSTNPYGTILGSILLNQTKRHEYNSSTQSHYSHYASSIIANNLGDYFESAIGSPGIDPSVFANQVASKLTSLGNKIYTDTNIEPYGVNINDSGIFDGNFCYSPYTSPATCQ